MVKQQMASDGRVLGFYPAQHRIVGRGRDQGCVEFGGRNMLNAHPAVNQTWPLTRTVLIGQCRKRASYSRFIPLGQRSEKSHHIPECLQYKPCRGGGVITRNCNKHWSISSVPGPMAKCHWGLGQPVSEGSGEEWG